MMTSRYTSLLALVENYNRTKKKPTYPPERWYKQRCAYKQSGPGSRLRPHMVPGEGLCPCRLGLPLR